MSDIRIAIGSPAIDFVSPIDGNCGDVKELMLTTQSLGGCTRFICFREEMSLQGNVDGENSVETWKSSKCCYVLRGMS
jgi:hypothetical protein